MAALVADFPAAVILHDLSCAQLGFALRGEDRAGAVGVGLFHRPALRMVHHISVVLVHGRPSSTHRLQGGTSCKTQYLSRTYAEPSRYRGRDATRTRA